MLQKSRKPVLVLLAADEVVPVVPPVAVCVALLVVVACAAVPVVVPLAVSVAAEEVAVSAAVEVEVDLVDAEVVLPEAEEDSEEVDGDDSKYENNKQTERWTVSVPSVSSTRNVSICIRHFLSFFFFFCFSQAL